MNAYLEKKIQTAITEKKFKQNKPIIHKMIKHIQTVRRGFTGLALNNTATPNSNKTTKSGSAYVNNICK